MKKRSVLMKATIIALIMLTLVGQCFAGVNPFTDTNDTVGKDKILSLQEQGIIKGYGNGIFAPNAPLTAAQGIQLLVNAFDLNIDNIRFIKAPKASDYFKNADDDAWYANAFIIITFSGLELPSDLDPDAKWTREEFTSHLVKIMETKGNLPMINLVPVGITDDDQLNVLYSGVIQRALVYKLVQLDTNGSFRPKESITRSDAAVQVYNALEYLKAHPAPTVQ
ncbi:MAG TPA: S-layer homology domain-containing protein [Anaerovoracaceae bacterium]|nr:S-layer homology domain-containing protein [Anaerovoracaceae bacterium]